jgi:hypothetical protein
MITPEYRIQTPQTMALINNIPVMDINMVCMGFIRYFLYFGFQGSSVSGPHLTTDSSVRFKSNSLFSKPRRAGWSATGQVRIVTGIWSASVISRMMVSQSSQAAQLSSR